MTEPLRDPERHAMLGAAQRFTRALAAQAMLRATARIEAIVHAAEAEPVFLLEAALGAAWPPASGAAPRREVVWAREVAGGATELQLNAFDGEGRLLLRRSYGSKVPAAVQP
jgi:hypothetical protein